MQVKVQFLVRDITKTETSHEVMQSDGVVRWVPHFLHTVTLIPVQPDPIPDSPHPNRRLWKATAEAGIRLSYVNEAIGKQFVESKVYDVIFTEATPPKE